MNLNCLNCVQNNGASWDASQPREKLQSYRLCPCVLALGLCVRSPKRRASLTFWPLGNHWEITAGSWSFSGLFVSHLGMETYSTKSFMKLCYETLSVPLSLCSLLLLHGYFPTSVYRSWARHAGSRWALGCSSNCQGGAENWTVGNRFLRFFEHLQAGLGWKAEPHPFVVTPRLRWTPCPV